MTNRKAVFLPRLLLRLANATQRRGERTALAHAMGVPPQRVNDWLSGARAPGGEITLRLLQWVEAKETEENKNPEGALTPPGPVTQLRKSSYEKPKPNRKTFSHKGEKRTTKKGR